MVNSKTRNNKKSRNKTKKYIPSQDELISQEVQFYGNIYSDLKRKNHDFGDFKVLQDVFNELPCKDLIKNKLLNPDETVQDETVPLDAYFFICVIFRLLGMIYKRDENELSKRKLIMYIKGGRALQLLGFKNSSFDIDILLHSNSTKYNEYRKEYADSVVKELQSALQYIVGEIHDPMNNNNNAEVNTVFKVQDNESLTGPHKGPVFKLAYFHNGRPIPLMDFSHRIHDGTKTSDFFSYKTRKMYQGTDYLYVSQSITRIIEEKIFIIKNVKELHVFDKNLKILEDIYDYGTKNNLLSEQDKTNIEKTLNRDLKEKMIIKIGIETIKNNKLSIRSRASTLGILKNEKYSLLTYKQKQVVDYFYDYYVNNDRKFPLHSKLPSHLSSKKSNSKTSKKLLSKKSNSKTSKKY